MSISDFKEFNEKLSEIHKQQEPDKLTVETESLLDMDGPHIVFHIKGEPVLEFKNNGDILVQGRLATNDLEIVKMAKEFFRYVT